MNNYASISKFIEFKCGGLPKAVKRLGGGYYADVYLVVFEFPAENIVIKVYKTNNMLSEEQAQISILKKHSLFTMPQILWTHFSDELFKNDVLAMSFLEGENGGTIHYFSQKKRDELANQVIENLLSWHNTTNEAGFGAINSKIYCKNWNDYYQKRVNNIFEMAVKMFESDRLPQKTLTVMENALQSYKKIFSVPVLEASLIHGDYNMYNVLVNKKSCCVTAVIDPCNCMWADRELDLYQLNNANGKHLRLLENYAKRHPLSDNFLQKTAFYELFTEIEHYYKSGHPIVTYSVSKQTDLLKQFI